MKYLILLFAITTTTHLVLADHHHALFVRNEYLARSKRDTRQTNADQMVQNILQWLQGIYTQNSRKIRQGTLREYLPPSNTQKPRPFEPVSPSSPQPSYNGGSQGYPPRGSITPEPPFPIYTNAVTGAVTGEGYPSPPNNEITPPEFGGYPPASQKPQPTFDGHTTSPATGYPGTGQTPSTGYPSKQPDYTTKVPGFPTRPPPGYTTERPGFPTQPPPGYTTERPGFPTRPPPGYTTEKPGFPTHPPTEQTEPTGYPSGKPTGYPTRPPQGYTTQQPGYTTTQSSQNGYTTSQPGYTTQQGGYTSPQPGYTTQKPSEFQTTSQQPSTSPPLTEPGQTEQSTSQDHFTSAISTTQPPGGSPSTSGDDNNVIPTEGPKDRTPSESNTEDDLAHPPHIHDIQVQCAKDMMTINIEFNREFNGVIYSKGYYNMPECRYVKENSGQTKYSFTVSLNTCGTEFINAFDTQGKSYLENVLVLQNEPGIQEVWDTVRSVRCLWEGNLKESLSVALSVGMLSQEIVTFSGDTAMAKLDILTGKGPFGQPANGLVKIGEPMTLVVSVSGDPGFDIQVKDCRATDSTGDNVVPLTDDDGCVLKPKLFGAFQKTRNTGDSGASILAYAYFNAFKFPDVMDLMIECNIELCKTDCEMCPNPGKIDPGRRKRRDLSSMYNATEDGVTMGKHIRVVLPEDLKDAVINLSTGNMDGFCLSTPNFIFSAALLISLLTASCLLSAHLWLKNQRMTMKF